MSMNENDLQQQRDLERAYGIGVDERRRLAIQLAMISTVVMLVAVALAFILPGATTAHRVIVSGTGLLFFSGMAYMLANPQAQTAIVFECWAWMGTSGMLVSHLATLFGGDRELLLAGQMPPYTAFAPALVVFAWIFTARERVYWHIGLYCGLMAAASILHLAIFWNAAASREAMLYLTLAMTAANPAVALMMRIYDQLLKRAAGILAESLNRSRQAAEQAEQVRRVDPATGVMNRAGLDEQLAADLVASSSCAVMMIALERGDLLADAVGEQGFDALLRAIAARMQDGLGPETRIARRQGTHFVVWHCNLDQDEAQARAQALFDRLVETDFGAVSRVRFSAGLFVADSPTDVDFVVEQASFGLARAHDSGGGKLWIT